MKAVSSNVNFPEIEKEILQFWKDNKTFEESLEKSKNNKQYIFYDGPPFATGLPHYGHILTSYIKDTVPRYFTMKGYYVDRIWGWDCHGLPVEFEIEKELGVSGKKEIEEFGIGKFNSACKNIVLKYADEWVEIINRIGRWVDFSRQYKTMDLKYMESVMWAFQQFYEKGLVYESPKVVPYCNRCQTPLSNFETGLDDSYREKSDPGITVKLKNVSNPDQYFLVWTTTPWTLPSNVALAIGKDIDYSLVQVEPDELVWIANERIASYKNLLANKKIIKTVKGEQLIGQEYQPIFDFNKNQSKYSITYGDFVETSTGTGIVHLAPAFGEDDSVVCKREEIQGFDPVGLDGKFTSLAPDLEGMDVFDANKPIIQSLKEKGVFFFRENYKHNYPHCWRCDNPLIYRAISSWYIRVTDFREKMVENNKDINWIPQHIKEGRFGQWIEGARDWSISRNRYWGSPIPVWKCDGCNDIYVPQSIEQLESKYGNKIDDLHRPACDNVTWDCEKDSCNGSFKRVTEVLDCWFESGAMPFAQVHFPFENKDWFNDNFPASFIVEYISQTRGWFYTLLAESTALMDKPPFLNSICHGVVLAEDGRKMSKRLKNYPDPIKLVETYGSDALRISLQSSPVVKGQDICFTESGVKDALRRYIIPLWNSFSFFTTYTELMQGCQPKYVEKTIQQPNDKYILAELENLKTNVSAAIESYDLPKSYNLLLEFVETLSKWYIRINRPRFWKTDLDEDSQSAFDTLFTALHDFCKVAAPFIPFTAEYIFRYLTNQSVHLETWPEANNNWLDNDLIDEVTKVQKIIESIRKIRESKKLKIRQPLQCVKISGVDNGLANKYETLIKEQTNIKEIKLFEKPTDFSTIQVNLNSRELAPILREKFNKVKQAINNNDFQILADKKLMVGDIEISPDHYEIDYIPVDGEAITSYYDLVISLSLTITDELHKEGLAREMNRLIQDLRKKEDLSYEKRIEIWIEADNIWKSAFELHKDWIMEQCLATKYLESVENAMLDRSDNNGNLKIQIKPL